MKRTTSLMTLGLVAVLSAATAGRAGSIWAKAKNRTRALHADVTARKVGDSLTIIIDERSVIENETTRGMNKDTSRSAKTSGTLDLANVLGPVGKRIFDFPRLDLSSTSSTKFGGSTNYDSDHSMLDQITVTVEDVLPNGNLVVLGQRNREVAGDKQIVTVSGIVRPSDITFANTVSSGKVADFRVAYKGKGQASLFTKPGWLARILNFINPF